MSYLKTFESSIKEEIIKYNHYYKNSLKSKIKLLDLIANYIHYKKKNKLFPLLTILSAKVSGTINTNTYVAASIIDHLYIATQIHDDVEDESFSGNIFFKLNALWKEKLSVLMGDYFLAKGLILSVKHKTYDLLEVVSNSIKDITEGEISMLYSIRNIYIIKEEYFEIINRKSASLYSTCTKSGAISAGANDASIEIMSSFGRNFGTALFIKNELNFQNTIRNSKYRITLPFILALENTSDEEKEQMLKYLQSPINKDLTQYLQHFTEAKGGVEKSIRLMEDYKVKALEDITEFPYSTNLETLKQIITSNI